MGLWHIFFVLPRKVILIWILSLAFLSVGARNFEPGISVDGPVYATIARNLARLGNWFYLDSGIPDFEPFTEHPHLGFWVLGGFLKVLPAVDWAVRIVGHLYYVAFLVLFFIFVRRESSERTAVWAVLLLWVWDRFSNTFSNVYLDPGLLFWGTASLYFAFSPKAALKGEHAAAAGLSWALAFLYKGVAALGFGVPLALCLIFQLRHSILSTLRCTLFFLLSFSIPLALYVWGIQNSSVPNFLELYWQHQVSDRFGPAWQIAAMLAPEYWKRLLIHTHYLAPLALLSLSNGKSPGVILAWVTALTYIALFAGAGLAGNQYLIMVMPWIAWLIAEGGPSKIPFAHKEVVRITQFAAIALVLLIQYLPFRTHHMQPNAEEQEIARLKPELLFMEMEPDHFDLHRGPSKFITASHYAWYANTRVGYPAVNPPPRAIPRHIYLLAVNAPARPGQLKEQGWCNHPELKRIWTPCSSTPRINP